MKTMTCKQMGGPCDEPFQGETAEEIMNNGSTHVKKMADQGDEEHKKVLEMMDAMQNDPDASRAWNEKFMADFAALPED